MGSKKSKRTIIVNKKEFHHFYIGKGSTFGNPFEGEENSLEKYKKWFLKRMEKKRYRKEALKMRGKVLGCTCKSFENCHGRIIVDYIDNR